MRDNCDFAALWFRRLEMGGDAHTPRERIAARRACRIDLGAVWAGLADLPQPTEWLSDRVGMTGLRRCYSASVRIRIRSATRSRQYKRVPSVARVDGLSARPSTTVCSVPPVMASFDRTGLFDSKRSLARLRRGFLEK